MVVTAHLIHFWEDNAAERCSQTNMYTFRTLFWSSIELIKLQFFVIAMVGLLIHTEAFIWIYTLWRSLAHLQRSIMGAAGFISHFELTKCYLLILMRCHDKRSGNSFIYRKIDRCRQHAPLFSLLLSWTCSSDIRITLRDHICASVYRNKQLVAYILQKSLCVQCWWLSL